jgi:hypothetical protein
MTKSTTAVNTAPTIAPLRPAAADPNNRSSCHAGAVEWASAIAAPAGEELAYETIEWSPPEGARLTDALYEEYALQSIRISGSQAHPTKLVQSAAMASVNAVAMSSCT